ncbi:HD domain-containing protein [bacterium]|nr:HD domain-containing protein [bacterium]
MGPALVGAVGGVCERVRRAGGRAWLVGGTVRDCALGLQPSDADLEVFGLEPDRLQELLAADYPLDLVGRSFGILKLKDWPIDVGVPRRESKSGQGHRGFVVAAEPSLPLAAAAARRDFTINAIYLDPLDGEVADPWRGLDDLEAGRLRHTSAAFAEDPLRVLRAMQLASRFLLTVEPETVAACRRMTPEGLPRERLFGEWEKLLVLGGQPSRGLDLLRACGWLQYCPELAALPGCPQDARWHPEGDVWTHTRHCLDAFAAELTGDRREDLVVGLAVLCHDLGKPGTTETVDGRVRALGHEDLGVERTLSFLARLTGSAALIDEVVPLVREHMRPAALHRGRASDAAVRRLAARVGRIDRLVRVARADAFGRPPRPAAEFPAGDRLLAAARRLAVATDPPAPLVLGRHLLALGLEPGPRFGRWLERCYEAQLGGRFTDEAGGIAYAARLARREGAL